MALNTQDIFDAIATKYGATSENESFILWFFMAMTRVMQDLASSRVGISITAPETLETNIDCDDDYFNVVVDGLNKYIQESGMWGNDDPMVLGGRYERSIKRAHTYYKGTQTVYTRTSGA